MIAKKQRVLISVCVVAVLAAVIGMVSTCTVQKRKNMPTDIGQAVPEKSTENEKDENIGETENTEEVQKFGSTKDAGADDDAEESGGTGENLQKFLGADHSFYEANKNLDGFQLQESCEAFLNHDVDGSGEITKEKVEVYTGDGAYGHFG